jgi:hypothetical protein
MKKDLLLFSAARCRRALLIPEKIRWPMRIAEIDRFMARSEIHFKLR